MNCSLPSSLRRPSPWVLLALLAALLAPAPAQARAETAGALHASRSVVAPGGAVDLSGSLPLVLRRTVVLQRSVDGAWVEVARKRSRNSVAFRFTTAVPDAPGTTARYRVRAPKAKKHGIRLGALVTPVARVDVRLPEPPPPAPGTRANPHPVGAAFTAGDWTLALAATDTEAWPEIEAENEFNEPPLPGWTYVTVPVTMTYTGADVGTPWLDVETGFVDATGVVRDAMDDDQWCGVVPGRIDEVGDLYPGATATGAVCAVVPVDAVEGGSWRVRTDWDASWQYVSLR